MADVHSPGFVEGALAFAWRRWRLQRRFRHKVGYWGDFETPTTCEEKIQFRKLYGNHRRYALMADNYRVRQYVAERASAQYLMPLLGVYDRLTPEVFDSLPEQFVIKANHGCKWQRIVWNKADLDIPATVRYFNRLMHKYYGHRGNCCPPLPAGVSVTAPSFDCVRDLRTGSVATDLVELLKISEHGGRLTDALPAKRSP